MTLDEAMRTAKAMNEFVTIKNADFEMVGMFGVDVTEMSVSNGAVIQTTITFAGSGYGANAAVTVTEPSHAVADDVEIAADDGAVEVVTGDITSVDAANDVT